MENFETVYRENYRRMFALSLKMIGDEDEVRDVVQEVFICYYEKTQAEIVISNIQSWLIRATINKSIDSLRKRKKRSDLSVVENHTDKEEKSIDKDQSEYILRNAIKKLNNCEKKLVILYSEGFSYKEIADITDIKYTSVGKKLTRTLDKLRKILIRMNYEMY